MVTGCILPLKTEALTPSTRFSRRFSIPRIWGVGSGNSVSRTTVVTAYDTLRSEDLLDSQADTQEMAAVAMTGTVKDMSVYELLETLGGGQAVLHGVQLRDRNG